MTFEQVVLDKCARMLDIPETIAGDQREGRTWTSKQELGHLIDSAMNNHGRIVRAALEGHYSGPSYDQNGWVQINAYQELQWAALVMYWRDLNLMLARVVARIPPDRMSAICTVGSDAPVTLQYLIEDYQKHLLHHIDQIFT